MATEIFAAFAGTCISQGEGEMLGMVLLKSLIGLPGSLRPTLIRHNHLHQKRLRFGVAR